MMWVFYIIVRFFPVLYIFFWDLCLLLSCNNSIDVVYHDATGSLVGGFVPKILIAGSLTIDFFCSYRSRLCLYAKSVSLLVVLMILCAKSFMW